MSFESYFGNNSISEIFFEKTDLKILINAETSDLNPSVMCTSKSGNRHSLCFLFIECI